MSEEFNWETHTAYTQLHIVTVKVRIFALRLDISVYVFLLLHFQLICFHYTNYLAWKK